MNTPTPDIPHKSMDAKRQVELTMLEIQEITYQLNQAMKNMKSNSAGEESPEAGIHDEKSIMLQHIIDKLQS